MPPVTMEYFYDYVDPASYLVDRLLRSLAEEVEIRLAPRPFELRRPPAPMVDPDDARWQGYLEEMANEARRIGVEFSPPRRVPWSRKAHELALQARQKEKFPAVHGALFRAHFVEGRDVGRVDVLIELAADAGLDPGRTKAALDVDRHLPRLREERSRAERLGVRGVPTLLAGDRKLEGFRTRDEIRTFVRGAERS